MKQIKEEDKEQDKWYEEAKKMTAKELPEFVRKLSEDYGHDYGTICHAVTAAALGAAHAVNRSEHGGITGFQASCIMWGFIKNWMHYEGGMRLQQMDDLLFPQMEYKFNMISLETWADIQKKAAEHLKEKEGAHPDVVAHWGSICAGKVPFGLRVEEEIRRPKA